MLLVESVQLNNFDADLPVVQWRIYVLYLG